MRPMRFLYDKVMRPVSEVVGVFSACKGHEAHVCSISIDSEVHVHVFYMKK